MEVDKPVMLSGTQGVEVDHQDNCQRVGVWVETQEDLGRQLSKCHTYSSTHWLKNHLAEFEGSSVAGSGTNVVYVTEKSEEERPIFLSSDMIKQIKSVFRGIT